MTAREFLDRASKLDQRINSKLEQVSALNDLALKTTSTFSAMPHIPNRSHSGTADIIVKIIDLQNEINSDVDELVDIKQEIMKVIKAVDDTDCQLLLEMRYLCGRSWDQIAVDMGYGLDNIYKIHRCALQLVEDVLKCVQQNTVFST